MEKSEADRQLGPVRKIMVEVETEGENLLIEGEIRLPVSMESNWPLDAKLRGKLTPELSSRRALTE